MSLWGRLRGLLGLFPEEHQFAVDQRLDEAHHAAEEALEEERKSSDRAAKIIEELLESHRLEKVKRAERDGRH